MTTAILDRNDAAAAAVTSIRMHHSAYVSADPERTRVFYEDIIGLPLSGFWIENETLGGVVHEFRQSRTIARVIHMSCISVFNASLKQRDYGHIISFCVNKRRKDCKEL